MGKLHLTMACWSYDRTRALMEGRIPIDGVALNYLDLPVEETFFRMIRRQEFDVAEMSLSSYTLSLFNENPPFIALPVFVSRSFRHSGIYIHTGSGIREPQDLIGKRIGTPEYQLTAVVWIRGILSDEYDVPVSSVNYFTGGGEQAGRIEKVKLTLPSEIQVKEIPRNKTLSSMLETGEIDAMYAPRAPGTLRTNPEKVQRLFSNYASAEREYYLKTKIFPVMHVIVIRRELYEKYAWVAQSLYKAFVAAQQEVYDDLRQVHAFKSMLPWLPSHVEDAELLMGQDFWPYGYEPNVHVLETFLRYSYEQGLSKRLLDPCELFPPEVRESFKI